MYKNSIPTATVPQRLCKNTNKKVTTWQSCRIIATVAASKSAIDMLYMIGRAVCLSYASALFYFKYGKIAVLDCCFSWEFTKFVV